MDNIIFVDIQGFKDDQNCFIIKELALSTRDITQVFLIKPPYSFSKLSSAEKRRVRWIERHRGITWSEGNIDYREFKRLAIPILQHKTIIMKGLEKQKWIKELCETCVLVDIEEKGSPNFSILYSNFCNCKTNFNCVSHRKECALKNVMCIKKWYLDNCI